MIYLLQMKFTTEFKGNGMRVSNDDKIVKYGTDIDELAGWLFNYVDKFKNYELDEDESIITFTGSIHAFKGEDDLSCVYGITMTKTE